MRADFYQNKKAVCLLLALVLFLGLVLAGCRTVQPSSIVVKRGGELLDDGQLFVYINGKVINKNQPIGRGQTRTITLPNGTHRIWVKVDHLESDRMNFSVNNSTVNFTVTADRVGGSRVLILERQD